MRIERLAHSSQGQSLLPIPIATTCKVAPSSLSHSALLLLCHHSPLFDIILAIYLFLVYLSPLKELKEGPSPFCLLHFPLPSTEPGKSRC